ncbi:hypothetical protein, partial [Janibacter hoylei]|uniref:hypothetical protein n=1 Tax=Janibacter hoylei TaxID=364298 RepID=UPI00248FCA7C
LSDTTTTTLYIKARARPLWPIMAFPNPQGQRANFLYGSKIECLSPNEWRDFFEEFLTGCDIPCRCT